MWVTNAIKGGGEGQTSGYIAETSFKHHMCIDKTKQTRTFQDRQHTDHHYRQGYVD